MDAVFPHKRLRDIARHLLRKEIDVEFEDIIEIKRILICCQGYMGLYMIASGIGTILLKLSIC